jgi:hypothetical protein
MKKFEPRGKEKAPCCINWPSVIEEELEEEPDKAKNKKCLKTTSKEKMTKKNSRRK